MAERKINIPVEALLGVLLLIIVIGLAAIFWLSFSPGIPQPEVCDLQDNDLDGEVDEGFAVTCTTDSDCGPTGTYGGTYCLEGDVWQQAYESRCVGEIDTCQSECVNRQTEVLVDECRNGCEAGSCVTGQRS